jgi:glycosyltransferase involved in cell wall biosynthesis
VKLVLYFFSLAGAGGGAERTLVRLAAELHTRGHDVQVAASFYPVPPGIRWNRLGAGHGVGGKVRRTTRLVGLLRRERPDLFVGFVMGADASIYAANRLLGVPIVAAERNAPDMYRMRLSTPRASFYLHMFRLCRGIVVQLESYRRVYPPRVRDRIVVIPNAVDVPPAPVDAGRASDRFTLLSVGRLSPQKRFDVLIDAFHAVAARAASWDLCIVGDGNERAALEARVRAHGLEGRVRLPGAVADVRAEYARAHLFVLPSRWEGFPNALAEALAHGLPGVGFAAAPGVNALIAHGETGLLAPGVDDAAALADAMAALMRDPEARRTMGRNAVAAMRAYDARTVYDRWTLFLERCARGPRPDFTDLA